MWSLKAMKQRLFEVNGEFFDQKEAEAYEFYKTVAVFRSVNELRSWQKKGRWPKDQVAFH